MGKYNIITYGCQMNEHDSENIAGILEAMGYEHEEDAYKADVVVINTCSVRENADKRFFGVLGQFKKIRTKNPDFILCVCGCMPQQPRIVEKINKQFSWVDIVFGTQNIAEFPQLLEKRISTGRKQRSIIDNNPVIDEDEMKPKRMYEHKALVNITYGCNNFCTYCIVPYTRGREKSRVMSEVVREIECLAADGVKEVMLLGQNVDSYRDPAGHDFADLIHAVNDIEGISRIRFMTSHPKDLSDELIDVMSRYDSICNHLHLPVQSGSNKVLQRMNRHYTREAYFELVEKLRRAIPDISLTTDIMVGFPGESREDIEDTIDLIRQVGFDNAFTFIYSKRTGTPAASMPDQIDPQTASGWFDQVLEAVHETAAARCARFTGTDQAVLVEDRNRHRDGWLTGRTQHNLLVHFEGPADLIGTCVPVEITESKGFYLIGRRV